VLKDNARLILGDGHALKITGYAKPGRPIVVSETEARQATKEGVVRYILLVSLVLVVVLFAVAYVIFR
jgi:hypothetical protein